MQAGQGQGQAGQDPANPTNPTTPATPPTTPPAGVTINVTQADWDRVLAERDNLANTNETLAERYERLFIAILPPERQQAAQTLFADVKARASATSEEAKLEQRARAVIAKELYLDNRDYGVKEADLVALSTAEEMERFVLTRKSDYYKELAEKGGAGAANANPGNIPSDKGGTGQGGSPAPKIEGKGSAAVSSHIANLIMERTNARAT